MKAMICFNGINGAGLSEGFQGIPAPLLPIANKPLVEYYIELCSCLHINEFLILDSDYSEEAAARIGDGSRWSVKIAYRGASQQMAFQAIRKRQAAFLGTEDVLCFNGLVFPFCDYRTVCIEDLAPGAEQPVDADLAPGLYWFTPERCQASVLPVLPLLTYVDYFKCCQAVMQAESAFFPVPGYHVEAGIYTGMNVVFPPSCTVASPAVIGNHVRLIDEVKLEGAVILGDRVMVDRRTTLHNAIVIDNTYVGSDLEIRDKIVCRDRIIDPESNTVLHLGADCLFMGVRSF
ncbi:MAG TPA: sugar phosphate nucleotidyltransferase, partial [Lentisphaeria bacterium]|nr:sugar phosphate nucleotidyltransferase [Lentisphaeria bacterium]